MLRERISSSIVRRHMDPLSEVLSLLKLKSYMSGGFVIEQRAGHTIPAYQGVKCYVPLSGSCWLSVDGSSDPIRIKTGDCVILPRGLPFCFSAEKTTPSLDVRRLEVRKPHDEVLYRESGACSLSGVHFLFTGSHYEILLNSLPPIVHITKTSDKAVIRWSLESIVEEFRHPQPGGSLIAQQLAHMILVQALRLHLREEAAKGMGWLFALADAQMRAAITCIHNDPAHSWTIQELAGHAGMSRTVFAQTFKKKVGKTSMQYLTRWRMSLAAARLRSSDDPVSVISSAVGYKTESAFGKTFPKVWGCSPREHRQDSGSDGSWL